MLRKNGVGLDRALKGKSETLLGILFLVFFICCTSISVQAASDTGMSLEDLLNLKVTVASKTEQTTGDAPSSVTVITREEMKNMGVGSVEELLNYIPGFVVTRNVTSFRKENVTVRGGRFYDILFLYNGQRINGLYQGGFSDGNQYIPVENIKQIEIIRGPGSALYGSNAFLGVVNIVTVDDVNDVTVAAGDMERKEASINVSSKEDDLTVAGFVKGFSDLGYKYGEVTDSWGQTEVARDPTKGFNASLNLKYKNFTLDLRHNETQIEDFIMFGSLGNGINNGKNSQSHINMRYLHVVNDQLDFDISTGFLYDRWDARFTQLPVGAFPVAMDENGVPTAFNSQILAGGPYLTACNSNVNMDVRYKVTDTNNLITGISLEYGKTIEASNQGFWNYEVGNDFEHFGMLDHDVQGKEFNPEENRKVVGLYLQDQQQVGDSLTLTGGVRYDNYNDFGDSLNPRAAVVYSTPFQSKVKYMYGQAFRAPNFSELYDANNPNFSGNDDLDAEKVETHELAYVQNFKYLQGTVTYFHSKVTDMILAEERLDPNDPTSPLIYDNLGTLKTKGIELELKVAPISEILCSFTYLHFIDPDKEILSVPANTGSVSVTYKFDRFSWNVSGLYRESMKLVKEQDDYFIFNTTLYANLTENLRLKGTVQNLADEEYHTYDELLPEGIMNRGRTFIIGIECPL